MSGAELKLDRLGSVRFDIYRFDDFEPAGQPRFSNLESELTLEEVHSRFQTMPREILEEKLVLDAWRGGAFLTPELLVIIAGDVPRV